MDANDRNDWSFVLMAAPSGEGLGVVFLLISMLDIDFIEKSEFVELSAEESSCILKLILCRILYTRDTSNTCYKIFNTHNGAKAIKLHLYPFHSYI